MKTKTQTYKKTFDAVKFMREQRDRISRDIMNMTSEEMEMYFEQSKSKRKLKSNTAQSQNQKGS